MNQNKLRMVWSKREKDFVVYYPNSRDGHLVHNLFNNKRYHPLCNKWSDSFVDELRARGYDLSTIKFEITRFPKEKAVETNNSQQQIKAKTQ